MGSEGIHTAELELRAASGPTAVSFRLQPPGPVMIGRRSASALQLNDPAVSRDHARLSFRPASSGGDTLVGEWLLDDLRSIHGTWLNGVRVKYGRQYHLRAGDLIVIGPWTLHLVDRSRCFSPGTTLATVQDTAGISTIVSRFEPADTDAVSYEQLQLLEQCSERIHAARTEAEVAEAALDAAVAGTNFTAVAFLRPMTDAERVEVVSARGRDPGDPTGHDLSHHLIREAASGSAACLQRGPSTRAGPSDRAARGGVVALCVPVLAGSTLVGFMYFDSPSNDAPMVRTGESRGAFPLALARVAAMGLANLMRMDVELRQERMDVELRAAAEAKRWLLPPRQGQDGPFRYIAEARPGRFAGGDFFDIIPLANQRLAVVMGEVGGRGIPASMLVSASQGFLHACLEEQGAPVLAVTKISRLYHSRIAHSRFLKLWVGVFDGRDRTLTYVSAGHGCALTVSADGQCTLLGEGNSLPVGVEPDTAYEARTATLTPGVGVLLFSDGFVEQRGAYPNAEQDDDSALPESNDRPAPFGVEGVQQCLQGLQSAEDEIAALFSALEEHAGMTAFDNDATAVLVRS